MASGQLARNTRGSNYIKFANTNLVLSWGTYNYNPSGMTGKAWSTGLFLFEMKTSVPFGVTYQSAPYTMVTKTTGSSGAVVWSHTDATAITEIDIVYPAQTPASTARFKVEWLAIGSV